MLSIQICFKMLASASRKQKKETKVIEAAQCVLQQQGSQSRKQQQKDDSKIFPRKLNNALLSNPRVKEEISRKKYKRIGLDEEQKWNIISMGVAFKRG